MHKISSMIIIVMGVCGCGKSTIAQLLADKLKYEFADADSFHSESNKAKMAAGTPLTDEDRLPWLQTLHLLTVKWQMEQQSGVIACSALKRSYRNTLRHGQPGAKTIYQPSLQFIYLQGSFELFSGYLAERSGHFMPAEMLRSQLDTLEEPTQDEKDCAPIDASQTKEMIVLNILKICNLDL